MPRLTVGLPLRNSARHLHEAIESVRRQTLRDWILLAVDDRSTDSTRTIVREFAARDERIVLVPIDEGPSSHAANWNRVIELAETELVSLFGHDDVMMPDLLERETRMIDDHPEMAFCFAQGPFIDSTGQLVTNKRGTPYLHPKWTSDRTFDRHALGPAVMVGGFVHPSSVMMRTAVARSIELFLEDMPLFFDLEYWSRLGDCGSVGYVAGDLLRYRLNPEGAYRRCIEAGLNLSDAVKLFTRTMERWKWADERRRTFQAEFYHSHANRAFREAEIALERADVATAGLQFAVCIALAGLAGDDLHAWIARWWDIRFLGRRFTSARRRRLLAEIASLPFLSGYLTKRYFSVLPRSETSAAAAVVRADRALS